MISKNWLIFCDTSFMMNNLHYRPNILSGTEISYAKLFCKPSAFRAIETVERNYFK
jgi:hypothetical protein